MRLVQRVNLRSRKIWSALLGMAISLGLFGYVLYLLFWSGKQTISFQQLIHSIGLTTILNISLIYAVLLLITVIGWGWIIGTLSGIWAWPQHFCIYCITSITRRLPGTIWYLWGRAVMYQSLGVARAQTVLASGLELAAIIMGGLLAALLTWPLTIGTQHLNPAWVIAGLCLGAGLLNPVVLRWAIKRIGKQAIPPVGYNHLVAWVVLYATIWLLGAGMLFVLTNAVHPLPISMAPTLMSIWASSGLISFLLSFIPIGLGIQELTLTALLSSVVGVDKALIIALLMRAVLTLNEILWALIAALLRLTPFAQPPAASTMSNAPDGSLYGVEGEKSEEAYSSQA